LINGVWDPVGKTEAGNSAGQLTALALNLACSEVPALQDPVGPFGPGLADLCLIGGVCDGMTVQAVFDLAEDVIGGGANPFTNSQLNGCVAAVNENFSGGGDNGDVGIC